MKIDKPTAQGMLAGIKLMVARLEQMLAAGESEMRCLSTGLSCVIGIAISLGIDKDDLKKVFGEMVARDYRRYE